MGKWENVLCAQNYHTTKLSNYQTIKLPNYQTIMCDSETVWRCDREKMLTIFYIEVPEISLILANNG